ncbi:hypothetical protein GCM10011504_03880 [Siccirubricoccus deserti]|uniref:Porin n=1 Tax=Siccirubricoccus deserti TaxID=2013562 RepID=A0A9X0QUA2_9PROT|nr:hypothetical protein [Siccirubricoccus deserti]MBC4013716.1 hypothetical protein [Siccirubricoccus deserti]GGC28934.1 hypothetical protein GCM10011504_03880 [Siccirubricoccus deserti]
MFRNALFASLIALGAAGVAQAQDAGPRLIGGGDNTQLVYGRTSSNLVGGGGASIIGGGDDLRITYGRDATTEVASGLAAELVGGGENAQLVYRQELPSDSFLVGQAARPRS